MSRKRYDDVIKFVASILFGTSFRQFHELIESLEKVGCSRGQANVTAIVFFAVFFRNVHGLIAYDLWVDNARYEPSFEQRPHHVVLNFFFGLIGAILGPYLFIYSMMLLRMPGETATWLSSTVGFTFFLFAPLLVYLPWNLFWLKKLCSFPLVNPRLYQRPFEKSTVPVVRFVQFLREAVLRQVKANVLPRLPVLQGQRRIIQDYDRFAAYQAMLDFTVMWLLIDFLWLGIAYAGLFFIDTRKTCDFCLLFSVVGAIAVLADYVSHVDYYFPVPYPPDKNFEFSEVWDQILPDGLRFCHWGGKAISEKLIRLLDIRPTDRVIEFCCGYGGTLSLLPQAEIVGIDRSEQAIKSAQLYLAGTQVNLQCADIRELPFPKAHFTKAFSQDGDAWLRPAKKRQMWEIARVMAPGGLFIYQSYVQTQAMPPDAVEATRSLLLRCGYDHSHVPLLDELHSLFSETGFLVENLEHLHSIYEEDNEAMLKRFSQNQAIILKACSRKEVRMLDELLSWEKELFRKGWWSGVMVTARRSE